MKEFSALGVEIERRFIGPKVKIQKLEDEKIIIRDFEFHKSKFEPKTNDEMKGNYERVLYLQVEHKGELKFVLGNYKYLFQQFEKITTDMLPFSATLVNENGWIMK